MPYRKLDGLKRRNQKADPHPPKIEKKRQTLYLPVDVVEYLAVLKARGYGTISDQVAELVRRDRDATE